jgi:hypothetical protein
MVKRVKERQSLFWVGGWVVSDGYDAFTQGVFD